MEHFECALLDRFISQCQSRSPIESTPITFLHQFREVPTVFLAPASPPCCSLLLKPRVTNRLGLPRMEGFPGMQEFYC